MYLADRSFGKPDKDKQSSYGSPGSWVDGVEGAKVVTFDDCKNILEDEKGNKECKWDFSPYMQFMPRILQTSAFAHAEKD